MKKIFVVTANYKQYLYYTRESPLFTYIDSEEKIIGVRNGLAVFVGEWERAKNLEKIKDRLVVNGFTILYY